MNIRKLTSVEREQLLQGLRSCNDHGEDLWDVAKAAGIGVTNPWSGREPEIFKSTREGLLNSLNNNLLFVVELD